MTKTITNLLIRLDFYTANGRICLTAIDPVMQEIYGKVSTNIPDIELEANEFVLKDYSENKGWAKALIDASPDLYLPSGKTVQIGNHTTCPIYRVTKKFITEQFEATYNRKSDIYEAHPTLWYLHEEFCK